MKILIADDHRITREGLRSLLENNGHQVIGEAESGEEAIEMSGRLNPDVILMDINMPGLNGIQAAERIIAAQPDSRIIGLSMHNNRQLVMGMLKKGAKGYLLKNASFTEVLTALEAAANGNVYLSPEVTGLLVEGLVGQGPKSGDNLASLTQREREVLQHLADGASTKSIAEQLYISIKTVEVHRRNLMHKLDIDNLSDLIKFAIREGLTDAQI